ASCAAKSVCNSFKPTGQSVFVRSLKKRPDNWGSRKEKRKQLERFDALSANKDSAIESKLAPLRDAVKKQGETIRKLKESGVPEAELKVAVQKLKSLNKALQDKQLEFAEPPTATSDFPLAQLEDLLKGRFFFQQVFIY